MTERQSDTILYLRVGNEGRKKYTSCSNEEDQGMVGKWKVDGLKDSIQGRSLRVKKAKA